MRPPNHPPRDPRLCEWIEGAIGFTRGPANHDRNRKTVAALAIPGLI
jgi:hypothetical protein